MWQLQCPRDIYFQPAERKANLVLVCFKAKWPKLALLIYHKIVYKLPTTTYNKTTCYQTYKQRTDPKVLPYASWQTSTTKLWLPWTKETKCFSYSAAYRRPLTECGMKAYSTNWRRKASGENCSTGWDSTYGRENKEWWLTDEHQKKQLSKQGSHKAQS